MQMSTIRIDQLKIDVYYRGMSKVNIFGVLDYIDNIETFHLSALLLQTIGIPL